MKKVLVFICCISALNAIAQLRQSQYETLAKVHQDASELLRKGEVEAAKQLLLKNDSTFNSKDNISTVLLAEAYLETKKKSKALKSLGIKFHNKGYVFDYKATKTKNDSWFYTVGQAFEKKRKPKKALAVYKQGIKRHSTSGLLYRALGELMLDQKQPEKALNYFLKGINRDPQYALNYYYSAKCLFKKDLLPLAMIYGETFVYLSPNSAKASEMSMQMFQSAMSNKVLVVAANVRLSESQKQLLGLYGYTRYLAKRSNQFQLGDWQAVIEQHKGNDFESMAIARAALIDAFFLRQKPYAKKSKLYRQHMLLKKENLFEVYQFWLMGIGQPEKFKQYENAHQDEVLALENWLKTNPLKLGKRKSKYLPSF